METNNRFHRKLLLGSYPKRGLADCKAAAVTQCHVQSGRSVAGPQILMYEQHVLFCSLFWNPFCMEVPAVEILRSTKYQSIMYGILCQVQRIFFQSSLESFE